jgi:hypothetical protein
MPRILWLVPLVLAACSTLDAGEPADAAAADPAGWRLASGKPPTQAEFTAVIASCQELTKTGSIDHCLSDLGLRRAP